MHLRRFDQKQIQPLIITKYGNGLMEKKEKKAAVKDESRANNWNRLHESIRERKVFAIFYIPIAREKPPHPHK